MVVLGRVREGPARPGHGLWLSRRRRPVVLVAGAALPCCSYIDHTARPPKRRKVGTQDQGWTG